LKALQKQSHCIKGTDVMVKQSRSKDSRSCSRGGILEENKETGRSCRGQEETWRNKRSRSRSKSRSRLPVSRSSKRSRSSSPLSYKRGGGLADVRRKAEKRWRDGLQLRMEETDAVMRKEIKLESLQEEPCPETGREGMLGLEGVPREQVKIKKEVEEFVRESDAVPEDHLGRLLKEDQENGTSPKKVILVMVLVFEEKEKAVKLLVNPKKQVEKAMQEMAKHLKKDPASLLFRLEKEGRRLTGKEVMGDLEGARIVITRLY